MNTTAFGNTESDGEIVLLQDGTVTVNGTTETQVGTDIDTGAMGTTVAVFVWLRSFTGGSSPTITVKSYDKNMAAEHAGRTLIADITAGTGSTTGSALSASGGQTLDHSGANKGNSQKVLVTITGGGSTPPTSVDVVIVVVVKKK